MKKKYKRKTVYCFDHTTTNEKRFLNKLGSHSSVMMSRLLLLKKYLISIPIRERWGELDRYKIEAHVKKLIDKEEGEMTSICPQI